MGSVAYPSTFMELRWVTTRTKKDKNNNNPKELNLKSAATIPVYISTNPSDINPPELRELFTVCIHSCYRFPRLDPEEPVDVDKLRVALSHSCALVSLFTRPLDCFETDFDGDIESTELFDDGSKKVVSLLGNLMDRLVRESHMVQCIPVMRTSTDDELEYKCTSYQPYTGLTMCTISQMDDGQAHHHRSKRTSKLNRGEVSLGG